VAIAVAALVLLTAGVAVGGILEGPRPDGNSSAADECIPASLPASRSTGPAFRLGIEGSPLLIDGQVGSADVPRGGGAWQVPDPGRAGQVPTITPTDVVQVHVEGDRCVRYLVAERAPASLVSPTLRERRAVTDAAITPSSPRPALGSVPDGDWVIRVAAYFETGRSDPGGLVIGERFFRVRVGEGPLPSVPPPPTENPDPTTAATPAVPCGTSTPGADPTRVVLTAPGYAGVDGAAEGEGIPIVNLGLGEQFDLATADDECALSWTITVFNTETGEVVDRDTLLNPDEIPAFASQNRWRIEVPVGPHDLVADLHLGPGIDVVRFWRVVGEGFKIPDLVLTGDDGATVTAVGEYCLFVELGNGYPSGGECGPLELPEPIPALRVAAWSRVTVEVPGWALISWNGQCGRVVPDGGGGNYFEWECSLGGFYVEAGQEAPGPAQFLARPGEQLVQISIQAKSDAGTYSVQMFVRVVGE